MPSQNTKTRILLPPSGFNLSAKAASGRIQLTVSMLHLKSSQKSKTASAGHPSLSVTPTPPFVS